MNVHLLRRAATLLRNPYLCNWDHAVAHALADWLDQAAEEAEIGRALGGFQSRSLANAVSTGQALLRSFGHSCGDVPDEPCRSCELAVPVKGGAR